MRSASAPVALKIETLSAPSMATARFVLETRGAGFTEFTATAKQFIAQCGAADGVLLVFVRHTSCSLTIQENADPDVQRDLMTAFDDLAPRDRGWVHDTEGPDDMPAHVKTMLSGVSLHVPVQRGALALGTWQGIYLIEHRDRLHLREIVLQFVGTLR